MLDTKRLNEKIANSGLKKSYIADRMNLSRFGLYKKINGENEFTATEIKTICGVLGIGLCEKESIFFADKVE